VRADALFLQRNEDRGVFLGATVIPASSTLVDNLSSNDSGFGLQPGIRMELDYRFDSGAQWQMIYYNVLNWSAGHTITADPTAIGSYAYSPWTQTDALLGGFDRSLGYSYNASLENVEINWLRPRDRGDQWQLDGLLGVRFMQWNDTFNLNGTDSAAYENIDTECYNYLIGAQVGATLGYQWKRFHLDLIGKAGLFANFVQQRESNLNSSGAMLGGFPSGFIAYTATASSVNMAGVVDLSATLSYQFTPHFSARCGYQLLYLPGLALAPEQLGGFGSGNAAFLHGPSAGIQWEW